MSAQTSAGCLICGADTTEEPDLGAWSDVELAADIAWRSPYATDGRFVTTMGRYRCCPVCTSWLPGHRVAPLPKDVAELVDALTGQLENAVTKHRVRSEMVGWYRHLAGQMRPVVTE